MAWSIVTPTVPAAVRGSAFSLDLETTGTLVGVLSFAITAGTKPADFTFDTDTGVLAATQIAGTDQTFTLTVTAYDDGGDPHTVTFTVTVTDSFAIVNPTVPTCVQGQAMTPLQLTTSGSPTGSVTYAAGTPALPSWLTVSSGGVIAASNGIPLTAQDGVNRFQVIATDANAESHTIMLEFLVKRPGAQAANVAAAVAAGTVAGVAAALPRFARTT